MERGGQEYAGVSRLFLPRNFVILIVFRSMSTEGAIRAIKILAGDESIKKIN